MSRPRTPQALIAMIRRVHSPRGRRRAGYFSIEGTRLIERAVRAGVPLTAVLVARRMADDSRHRELFDTLRAIGCRIFTVPDETVVELTAGRDLGPILGLVPLPVSPVLADVLGISVDRRRQTAEDRTPMTELSGTESFKPDQPMISLPLLNSTAPRLLLAAVDVVDPGNVGALTRTAHASGAAALLTTGVSDPFHPRATRISRGSIFRLPVVKYETAAALTADLHAHGVFAVATAAAGGTPLPEILWPQEQSIAVLMGNEADGLSPEIAAAVDARVTIPMAEGVDSYSVNAAAAILLYEAQRGMGKTSSIELTIDLWPCTI